MLSTGKHETCQISNISMCLAIHMYYPDIRWDYWYYMVDNGGF